MAAIGRAPIDPNHHKGMLAADDVTGEVFAVQGDAATGAINIAGTINATVTGSDGAIQDGVDDTIKATVKDLTNSNPLTTAIVDGDGTQITSFGGGTQYTEGDTDASITGTALMMEGAANALVAATGTAANGLDVDVTRVSGTVTVDGSGVTQPVSATSLPLPTGAATSAKQDTGNTSLATIAGAVAGTEMQVDVLTMPAVTVNAGTNLNTAALALETGGNLAAIKAKTDNIPAQGQALAAASLPVVLPAAQVTTLTPQTDALTNTQLRATAVPVSLASVPSHAVTNAGTFAVQVTSAPSTVVTATDLDVRPLVNTDVVTAELSAVDNAVLDTIAAKDFATQTTLAAINAKLVTGTDIGDVTINNATGASAVNIQDGGNSITVDANNLDIRDLTSTDVVTVTGGVGQAADVKVTLDSEAVVLGAGTAAIGKLTANSGVDIGDVTLTAGTDSIGKLLPPDVDVTAHTNYARKYYTSTGAATDGIIWSPAAGKRWHVVSMYIQVSAAATVTLEDDKAGGDDPVFKSEFAANSGAFLVFPEKYPLASGEDAADLLITTSAGNVYVTVTGYEV